MSQAKRILENQEAQRAEATAIAVKAGALIQCEFHPDMVWDAYGNHEEAYRIANARFQAGELTAEYKNLREVTDAIKAAIEGSGMGGCPICAKMLED